jgi:hypothetical protein
MEEGKKWENWKKNIKKEENKKKKDYGKERRKKLSDSFCFFEMKDWKLA